jgi:hypothetical protein
MSARRVAGNAAPSASNGDGMFKNLFDPKPEFPLMDGHPPQNRRGAQPPVAPTGVPWGTLPQTFEIVGTFRPFENIEEEDRIALEGGPSAASAASAASSSSDGSNQAGLSPEDYALLRQAEAMERQRANPESEAQKSKFSNSVVFSLRIRRILDDSAREEMATRIRTYTENKLVALGSISYPNAQQILSTGVKHASHSYKYSCLPEEKVLLWASTDDASRSLLTDIVLRNPQPATAMQLFFTQYLFVPYGQTLTFNQYGNQIPMPGDDGSVQYLHSKSYQTKWQINHQFIIRDPFPARLGQFQQSVPLSIFTASEFTVQTDQSGEQPARRPRTR